MKQLRFYIVVLVGLCLSASPAMADMYEMTSDVAINLRANLFSETGNATPDFLNNILYIGYNPGTSADKEFGLASSYGATNPMYYAVGFKGSLGDTTGDGEASVEIGASAGANNVLDTLKGLGSFDS